MVLVLFSGLVSLPAEASAGVKASVTRVKASPARQKAECPATVGFSARISVRGTGVVRYRWVRADGTKGAVKTIKVQGGKTATVRDRQVFDGNAKGWQAVQLLGTHPRVSSKAPFTVTCTGREPIYNSLRLLPMNPPSESIRAAVSVSATPSSYSGPCPTVVGFATTLQVSRVPARVAYRWIDSATGEGTIQYADFGAGGPRSRTLSTTLNVTGSGRGWKAVRVLGPDASVSSRTTYAVTCDTGPLVATPSVSPDTITHSGTCPTTLRFVGKVTVNKIPATVTYEWINDRGGKGPSGTLTFTGKPGSRNVIPYDHQVERSGSVTLRILSPTVDAATTWFTVNCRDGNPAGAYGTVTDLHFAGNRDQPCREPMPLLASGTISAPRGPADITYEWVLNGNPVGITDSAGSSSTGPWSWDVIRLSLQHGTDGTFGSVALKIHNDDSISPPVNYSSACVDADHDFTMIEMVSDFSGECASEPIRNRATIGGHGFTGNIEYQWFRRPAGGQWVPSGTPTAIGFTGAQFERRPADHTWHASQTETGHWKLAMKYGDETYETPAVPYSVKCAD
ncbi:hypothetical protein [Streptosporangium sp. LJ11]|uniref:hypothetical protein n=1 Tax=Streptosporangium sp. LJ11 TaxID=3436927 RepID=UPI003F79D5F4